MSVNGPPLYLDRGGGGGHLLQHGKCKRNIINVLSELEKRFFGACFLTKNVQNMCPNMSGLHQ